MRAISISEPGGPEVLTAVETDDPTPGAGEVVLDVVAVGLNRADVLQREGKYPPPPGASEIPGLECSGTIAALGEGVTGWRVGDEVCALLAGGGYADRVAVPAGQLLPVPKGVSLAEAAALPEAACTVWSNVFSVARFSPGEKLLVHGGSGGVGTFALQLAAAYGARVFTTASANKAASCRAYGAERVIDYRDEDFVAVLTQAGGADVILDNMGASYLDRNIAALAPGGRLVVIGLQGGRSAEVDLSTVLAKRATIVGTTLRSRLMGEKAHIVAEVRDHVWPLVDAGQVRPVIDRAFALADVVRAHEYLATGRHIGKVLLVR